MNEARELRSKPLDRAVFADIKTYITLNNPLRNGKVLQYVLSKDYMDWRIIFKFKDKCALA